MAYIGNTPAENYASFLTETFTVSATTNYTLSHAVANENDIRLVINGVVQQPGSGKAYTASGTTLTLSSATASGDVMYAVYLGRALQTVNPPAASVGNSQTAPTIITGQTAETSIATDDTILIHDTSASALRKMTRANFVSGIGGTNTPAFQAKSSASQTVSSDTFAKIQCNTEAFDTAGAYDNSTNYRFTVPSGQAGKYYVYGLITANGLTNANLDSANCSIYKNNSDTGGVEFYMHGNPTARYLPVIQVIVLDLSVGDYVELFGRIETDNGNDGKIGGTFGAYKIIE